MTAVRHRQPELMDQPDLDEDLHRQALAGLGRINALSRSAAILWPGLRHLARQMAPRPLRVLDVASGGGDVPLALARRAAREGFALHIDGCDISPLAVDHATSQATGCRNVRFFTLDALQQPLPEGYHAVSSSLFLHHLEEPQAQELLRKMASAAERLVLVNDLRRSRVGYALAWIGCRALSRSRIVHVDGPRSVAAAFTQRELAELASASGLDGATVVRRWPQRLLLSWSRR